MFVGVDLVKIARWERILEKFPRRTEKIFTEEEIALREEREKACGVVCSALGR